MPKNINKILIFIVTGMLLVLH